MANFDLESLDAVKESDSPSVIKIEELLSHIDEDFVTEIRRSNHRPELTMHRIKEILMYLLSNRDALIYVEDRMTKGHKYEQTVNPSCNNADESAEEGELMDLQQEDGELIDLQEDDGETAQKHSLLRPKSRISSPKSANKSILSEKDGKRNNCPKKGSSSTHFKELPSSKNVSYSSSRYSIPRKPWYDSSSATDRRIREKYRNRNAFSPRRIHAPKYSPSKLLSDRILQFKRDNKKILDRTGYRRRSPLDNDYNSKEKPKETHLSHSKTGSCKRRGRERRDSSVRGEQRDSKKQRRTEKSPRKKRSVIKVKISSNRKPKEPTRDDATSKRDPRDHDETHKVQSLHSKGALSESGAKSTSSGNPKVMTSTPLLKGIYLKGVSENRIYESKHKYDSTKHNLSSAAASNDVVVESESKPLAKASSKMNTFLSTEQRQHVKESSPISKSADVAGCVKRKRVSEDMTGNTLTKRRLSPRKSMPAFRCVKVSESAEEKQRSEDVENPESEKELSPVSYFQTKPTFRFVNRENEKQDRKSELSGNIVEKQMTMKRVSPRKVSPTTKFVKAGEAAMKNQILGDAKHLKEQVRPKASLITPIEMVEFSKKMQTIKSAKNGILVKKGICPRNASPVLELSVSSEDAIVLEDVKSSMVKERLSPKKALSTLKLSESSEDETILEDVKSLIVKEKLSPKKALSTLELSESSEDESVLEDVQTSMVKDSLYPKTTLSTLELSESSEDEPMVKGVQSSMIKKRLSPKKSSPISVPKKDVEHTKTNQTLENVIESSMIKRRLSPRKSASPLKVVEQTKDEGTSDDVNSERMKERLSPRKPLPIRKPIKTVVNPKNKQTLDVVKDPLRKRKTASPRNSPLTSTFIENVDHTEKTILEDNVKSPILEKSQRKSLSTYNLLERDENVRKQEEGDVSRNLLTMRRLSPRKSLPIRSAGNSEAEKTSTIKSPVMKKSPRNSLSTSILKEAVKHNEKNQTINIIKSPTVKKRFSPKKSLPTTSCTETIDNTKKQQSPKNLKIQKRIVPETYAPIKCRFVYESINKRSTAMPDKKFADDQVIVKGMKSRISMESKTSDKLTANEKEGTKGSLEKPGSKQFSISSIDDNADVTDRCIENVHSDFENEQPVADIFSLKADANAKDEIKENAVDTHFSAAVVDANAKPSNAKAICSGFDAIKENESKFHKEKQKIQELHSPQTSQSIKDSNEILGNENVSYDKSQLLEEKTKSSDVESLSTDIPVVSSSKSAMESTANPKVPSVNKYDKKSSVENESSNVQTPITTSPQKTEDLKEKTTESWTREQDREILLTCKKYGPTSLAFQMVSNAVTNKSVEEVRDRFSLLMNIFAQKLQKNQPSCE